ncbi:polysaccharide deacetylase family protein, partial [Streptomyces sp. CB01881]|uniref:polysaccharide deacetylase family protein n=1 Tax=Streptomyces sp. CB01881 TaxID=2078691 RepID=UPI001576FF3D
MPPLLTASAALALAAESSLALGAPPVQAASCANGYVALAFDDGPSGTTPTLLDALRQNGLRATMFNEGRYAAARPSLVRAQVAAGMWVANRSYTHSPSPNRPCHGRPTGRP